MFTSSLVAEHILRTTTMSSDVLLDTYHSIIRRTLYDSEDRRSGQDAYQNSKELMKFRLVSRIFDHSASKGAYIESLYERLSGVPRARMNPQFWLQYGMAKLEFNETSAALRFIETAESLARQRGLDYDDYQIVDQKARILLKLASAETGSAEVAQRHIVDACEILSGSLNSTTLPIYPMRSIPFLLDALEPHCESMAPESRAAVKRLISKYDDVDDGAVKKKSMKGEVAMLRGKLRECKIIIANS
tara:strand:+ start:197 stop:934 length:738 start_codon:yes stop_codon:yes gene_type:complete